MSVKCRGCGCDLVNITGIENTTERWGCVNTRCANVAPEAKRIATSPSYGPLIKALGLDGQMVTALTISIGKDGIGRMTIERVMSEAQVLALAPYLRDPDASVTVRQTVGDLATPEQMRRCSANPEQPAEAQTAAASPTEAKSSPKLQEQIREEVAAQMREHLASVVAGVQRQLTYGRGCGL